jgi:ribose-phosphate pyrophosphokinase
VAARISLADKGLFPPRNTESTSIMKLIAGTSNEPLAKAIAEHLGLTLAKTSIRRFNDMEVFVEILENVRGEDAFIIQPTSYPTNDSLMELLITIDTLKRSSARRITAVTPYYGYSRQDRKSSPRSPITAKLVANLMTVAGADRVLTMDLHAGQIQGFFDIPLDNLYAAPVFVRDIRDTLSVHGRLPEDLTIVSPDVGGVVRARSLAKKLNAGLAIIDKRREKANESEVMNIIGDIEDRDCIMVDDIVDSAGTLCNASEALMNAGAKSVAAYLTHGVFSGSAVERIEKSAMTSLTVTDSIAATPAVAASSKIRQLTVAPLLAEAIARIGQERSVSSLFE